MTNYRDVIEGQRNVNLKELIPDEDCRFYLDREAIFKHLRGVPSSLWYYTVVRHIVSTEYPFLSFSGVTEGDVLRHG